MHKCQKCYRKQKRHRVNAQRDEWAGFEVVQRASKPPASMFHGRSQETLHTK